MTILTVDANLPGLLSGLTERAELHDTQGNLIGYFTPRQVAEDVMYAEAIKSFDLVEAKRRVEEFVASGARLDRDRLPESPPQPSGNGVWPHAGHEPGRWQDPCEHAQAP